MLQCLVSQAGLMHSLNSELRLLNAVGSGGVCDQMGKLDEELRLAARLQQEFLPKKLPALDELSLHVLWRPANYVSGDIYDAIRLDEHHIGLFLADAVGHGVPAALMTLYIKRSLKTKHIDQAEPAGYRLIEPYETLARLNEDMLAAQSERVYFATACYGVLDTRTHELRLARAGHPYPLVLGPDGAMQTLQQEGGLLGVFPDAKFEQTSITLDPGDRLLLYSDGFELAFPESDGRGGTTQTTERYLHQFADLREGKPEAALDRLRQSLNAQAGSLQQQDDLTLLCLALGEPTRHETSHAPATVAAGTGAT
jgi:sigma-B regulation protein RsbU (phosphoserine phosphatase)